MGLEAAQSFMDFIWESLGGVRKAVALTWVWRARKLGERKPRLLGQPSGLDKVFSTLTQLTFVVRHFLVMGAVLFVVGCLAATLAST